jgi:hypothetical protein
MCKFQNQSCRCFNTELTKKQKNERENLMPRPFIPWHLNSLRFIWTKNELINLNKMINLLKKKNMKKTNLSFFYTDLLHFSSNEREMIIVPIPWPYSWPCDNDWTIKTEKTWFRNLLRPMYSRVPIFHHLAFSNLHSDKIYLYWTIRNFTSV